MLVLYIFILMFTNSINHLQKNIHSTYINRITIITLLFSILYTFNTLYFQSIGKGISLYNGLYQTTVQSHFIEILLLIVGISILLSWPYLICRSFAPQAVKIKGYEEKVASISKSDQYSLIAIFSILGGSLLMSSLDLLSMYLSIELQSFALYILATLNKDKLSATSAGLKYFLLGSLSSCFILLGSAIIYSYTGLTQFEAINSLLSVPFFNDMAHLDTYFLNKAIEGSVLIAALDINKAFAIGLIIIIIGFLFKISAAPFYQWAPDVYDGVPTIVTVWLTIVVKLTILIFLQGLIEFTIPDSTSLINNYVALAYHGVTGSGAALISQDDSNILSTLLTSLGSAGLSVGTVQIKNLLLISSLLSLLVGTIAGLSQIKVKRLLAFSSISHVGFLLLALGIYTQKSVDSFIFYLVQYSITSLNIFLIFLAFGYLLYYQVSPSLTSNINAESLLTGEVINQGTKDINYLIELKGQLHKNPLLSISLAICLFSMAGIPPLIGFFSKQFVLFSSIENGNNFLSIVAILVSVISASYYLKLIKITFFSLPCSPLPSLILCSATKRGDMAAAAQQESYGLGSYYANLYLSNVHSYIIAILTFLILFFFLYPSILLNGTQLISLTIFNL